MVALVQEARRLHLAASIERRAVDSLADVWAPLARTGVELDASTGNESDDELSPTKPGDSTRTPAPGADQPDLPWGAKLYVGGVTLAGACLLAAFFPQSIPTPALSAGLLALVLIGSAFKVQLPCTKTSATMSASFIANFMCLILVGPSQAMLFAGAGALLQCLVNRRQRQVHAYRVLFSISALVVTVYVTGVAYVLLGGRPGTLNLNDLATPIVGGGFAYFVCNALLVAVASALATRQSPWRVGLDALLWSGPSFFVGAGVAVAAAWFIDNGQAWSTLIVAVPAYLTYRAYQLHLGLVEDERRHVAEVSALNTKAMHALDLAERSERALAIEKQRLVVTLGSIGEAVVASDTRGRIVIMNHTAELFTGWPQERAVGTPVADVFRLVDRDTGKPYSNPVDKVIRMKAAVDRDNQAALVARDGSQRLVEHSATPVCDDEGATVAVVLVARDTTDSARIEAERERASKLASLGVLAGGIAHDFNNILTAIVGNIYLAQLDGGEASRRNNLSEAEAACVRAKALTHQLLTFAKGGKPLKKPIFLQDIIREGVSFALRGSNVRCDFRLADDLWAVDADENQIRQVVNNLVLNAIQAMPGGGVVEVRAENAVATSVEHSVTSQQVRIAVRDYGVGIPEAHLGRIFDPYFTTKSLGSGLGLATAHSIVTNHGGHIAVESTVAMGTTMTLIMPAIVEAGRPGLTAEPARLPSGLGRVLIMDDERGVRDVTRAMLGRRGFRVEVAAEGHAAIELYTQAYHEGDRFDAVIMDLTVPGGMGGKDAVKELLAFDPDIVAVVSSGYADDPVMSEYEQYGFKGVVPKPFTIAELTRVLQQVME